MDLSGFILAGGRSSRMGTDKSRLRFGDSTLIESAIRHMRTVTNHVFVVSPRADLARYAPIVHDVYPDRGPLGGIHAALASSQHEFNLMLAVDMPLVPAELLEKLVAIAQESRAVVTVPQTSDGLQPLCAVYRKEFAMLAERALRTDDYKIDRLFKQIETRIVNESELGKWGYSPQVFMNLNTPDDLRSAVTAASRKDQA
jgi:molybdenum cofactor guanylyltransferase